MGTYTAPILGISIHALCEEGDGDRRRGHQKHQDFYPRPLRGGRPTGAQQPRRCSSNFYPRPLRGGRPQGAGHRRRLFRISIHALCEEGDLGRLHQELFQQISIHALCEEGDGYCGDDTGFAKISIHALCEEGDPM